MLCVVCAKRFNRPDLRTFCKSACRRVCTILLSELEIYFPMLIPAHIYGWLILHVLVKFKGKYGSQLQSDLLIWFSMIRIA